MIAALERAFDDALVAVLPNPVALRFTDLRLGFQGKRDLVFALDLLEEGENEAALIAGLANDALTRDPSFDAAHLLREAWYYLRTSIDPAWQFDNGPIAFETVLTYVETLLRERVAVHVRPTVRAIDAPSVDARRALLRDLRSR